MCSVRTGGGSQRKLIKRRQHTFPPKHAILDDEEEQEIPDVEHKQHLCRRDEWFAICGVSSAVLAVAMFEGNARVFVSSLSNHNHADNVRGQQATEWPRYVTEKKGHSWP